MRRTPATHEPENALAPGPFRFLPYSPPFTSQPHSLIPKMLARGALKSALAATRTAALPGARTSGVSRVTLDWLA